MQRLEGLMRKAMQMYRMISAKDKICVGVSGGKDSMALAVGLKRLSAYYELPYTVCALTLDPCFDGVETDYGPVAQCLAKEGIEHHIIRTNIGPVVFGERREKNPCSLCAKMRRGALHRAARELGCGKVALGHHLDDAVETFYMNLFRGGAIGCFSPVTWLSRSEISLIRPLVLAREHEVAAASRPLPVIKSKCPVDGDTERARMKEFVRERQRVDGAFCEKTLGAMQKAGIDGWKPLETGIHRSRGGGAKE